MSHTCHAIACKEPVPQSMFMCKHHWYLLPAGLRNSIWATYRPGQETVDGPAISKSYCEVAKECIKYVAKLEGREVTGKEHELILYDKVITDDISRE